VSRTEQKRFWPKVRILGPDECWIWLAARKGAKNKQYGNFTVKRDGRFVQTGAHILAWEYAHGPVPDGLFVCHKCDVMLCVNARHLFLGTALDNNRDMAAKRRVQHGERHWNCTLTDSAVASIRSAILAGESQRSVARRLSVNQSTVSRIASMRRRVA
jgi:hypothetical protein